MIAQAAGLNEGPNLELIIAAGFGICFILILIILSIRFPKPTHFQYNVFRTVLSLAAAGAGAMIPGFLNLNLTSGRLLVIQAGGAVSVFVITYFFNPARLAADPASVNSAVDPSHDPNDLPRKTHGSDEKKEAFFRVWDQMANLQVAGERLWNIERVDGESVANFANSLAMVTKAVQDEALFFKPETYNQLLELLRAADFYVDGKRTLLEIRGQCDLNETHELQVMVNRNEEIRNQLQQNRRWLTRYGNLLRKIRDDLHEDIFAVD